MANPLHNNLLNGTIGELLTQIRLLQCGIQAAPPIKDSGNDLIALNGLTAKCIQVKATTKDRFKLDNLPEKYHLLILVKLEGTDNNIFLDKSKIFLLTKEEVVQQSYLVHTLSGKILNKQTIDRVFKDER